MNHKDMNHGLTLQHKSNDDSDSSLRLEMGIRRMKTKLYDTIVAGLEMGIRGINTKLYYVILAGLTIIVISKLVPTDYPKEDATSLVSEYRHEKYLQVHSPEYLLTEQQRKQNVAKGRPHDTVQSSLSNTGSTKILFAMISTPLMEATGFLPSVITPECMRKEMNAHDDKFSLFNCPEGHSVLQSRKFDTGSKVIEQYRKENPEDDCLIVTAIRDPMSWFQSYFLHSLDSKFSSCKLDEWASKEAFLMEFKKFVQVKNPALSNAIPDLLNEFNGGSLQDQVMIMERGGGDEHSTILGPAPPGSIVAGCNLLLMKMKNIDPNLEFVHKEWATEEECPQLPEYVKVITDYEMTIEEKQTIYQSGDDNLRDWFDAYGYL